MSKRSYDLFTVGILLALACAVIFGLPKLAGPPRLETRVSKYQALRAEWDQRGLAAHFPKSIPTDAQNVKFSAFPGYLQGGAWLQLRLRLPPPAVDEIVAQATQTAKDTYAGGDKSTSINERSGGLPGTSFFTADNIPQDHYGVDFPSDYRIYVYDAQTPATNSSYWNHGTSRGVVVSSERHEVIFFAESW